MKRLLLGLLGFLLLGATGAQAQWTIGSHVFTHAVVSQPTVVTPSASLAPGTYSGSQSDTLSTSTGGAFICYTTDGSTPTASTSNCTSGTLYSGPITISSSETVNAIAALSGDTTSAELTVSYTITVAEGSAATPVLAPFADTGRLGDNAVYSPTSPTTGAWVGCTGTNPCLTFLYQAVGTPSMSIPIAINNCSNPLNPTCNGGTGSLAVTSATITGANASDFTLTGTGGCTTIATNGHCLANVTFTPSTTGTRTATLTINYSGAAVSSQTMSLSGIGIASCTALTSCGTLASSTNYCLSNDVSGTGSCFIFNGNSTDLNLNGHKVTFCSAGGTSLVGGIFVNSFNEAGLMVHNGTVAEAAGKTCTGLTGTNGYGSAPFMVSSTGNTSSGRANGFVNLYLSTNEAPGNVIFEEYGGTATSPTVTTMHDVQMTMNGTYNCPLSTVGCRSGDQFYAVVEDQVQNAAPWNWYNIGQTGGTQGGIGATSPGSAISYTLMSPGSTVATNSNGFAIQSWFTGTVSHNLAVGSGIGGALISARGGQLASINGPLTGANISNDVFVATYLANNGEYAGCALGGAYAYQLNTAGNGNDLSNNTVSNNYLKTITGVCESYAFSDSGSTIGAGPNVLSSNHIEADIDPGTYITGNAAAGIRLDSCQYSPCPANAITFVGNTILGDTADVFVLNTNARTFAQDTFGKGTNPIGGQLFMDFNHGNNTGNGEGLITVIDPVFLNGVTKDSNNLVTWARNNPSFSAGYLIEWTYTVTVEKASNSAPISGATVSITPANSGPTCTTTTNGSGVATCILPDTVYEAVTGTYSTISYNSQAVSITASGCTVDNYSKAITAITSDTIKLNGC